MSRLHDVLQGAVKPSTPPLPSPPPCLSRPADLPSPRTSAVITQCCMQALYDLGEEAQDVVDVAKGFERRKCNHLKARPEDECLTTMAGAPLLPSPLLPHLAREHTLMRLGDAPAAQARTTATATSLRPSRSRSDRPCARCPGPRSSTSRGACSSSRRLRTRRSRRSGRCVSLALKLVRRAKRGPVACSRFARLPHAALEHSG